MEFQAHISLSMLSSVACVASEEVPTKWSETCVVCIHESGIYGEWYGGGWGIGETLYL